MDDSVMKTPWRAAGAPPEPAHDWALFLDLDGTLLDIAPRPDAVQVPPDLIADLRAAAQALDGALAIVSGRQLVDIDALLKPLQLPASGEHGAVVRLPNGTQDEVSFKVPQDWVEALGGLPDIYPGVVTELKAHTVVAHYRKAPKHEAAIRQLASELVSRDPDAFELLSAKMAIEIRPRAITKGRAVERLMTVPPFRGRVPVFVGDDATDEDGFNAVLERDGIAVEVAACFSGRPHEVRRWLKRIARI